MISSPGGATEAIAVPRVLSPLRGSKPTFVNPSISPGLAPWARIGRPSGAENALPVNDLAPNSTVLGSECPWSYPTTALRRRSRRTGRVRPVGTQQDENQGGYLSPVPDRPGCRDLVENPRTNRPSGSMIPLGSSTARDSAADVARPGNDRRHAVRAAVIPGFSKFLQRKTFGNGFVSSAGAYRLSGSRSRDHSPIRLGGRGRYSAPGIQGPRSSQKAPGAEYRPRPPVVGCLTKFLQRKTFGNGFVSSAGACLDFTGRPLPGLGEGVDGFRGRCNPPGSTSPALAKSPPLAFAVVAVRVEQGT